MSLDMIPKFDYPLNISFDQKMYLHINKMVDRDDVFENRSHYIRCLVLKDMMEKL